MLTHPVTEELARTLVDCRCIFVRNYHLQVSIGVYDHEKTAPQSMVFNVTAFVKRTSASPQHDGLDEVIDYDFVRNTITEQASTGHVQLQETLCDRIGEALMKKTAILAAYISSEKTEIYPDVDAIGVGAWYFSPHTSPV
ncbi:dihydroneopterin aldolase [Hydromonas duriensis]|uniref:Dihydroneopterin aldolase n=1 Tax=Hydromonas duriensis TaxID=1527608 RepID=A0A4R6Y7E1_9BURK|nr:dihydroneopterin aldolase [Hydromonas duriensis]TDR31243.1 dihydroneopterin aldolase [Hydromonas duriensis]